MRLTDTQINILETTGILESDDILDDDCLDDVLKTKTFPCLRCKQLFYLDDNELLIIDGNTWIHLMCFDCA